MEWWVTAQVRLCPPYDPIQIRAHFRKHAAEHVGGQHPRVGVVARAMIAVVKLQGAGLMHGTVHKRRRSSAQAQRLQCRIVRDPSQRYDGAQIGHGLDLSDQIRPAGVDLRRQRLVLRRHAVHRVADPAIDQGQPVIGTSQIDAFGKTIFEQGRIEQVAGIIAGEGTPGAVGALHARREADDHQPRFRIAEGGHR